jgi:hypothetical protein
VTTTGNAGLVRSAARPGRITEVRIDDLERKSLPKAPEKRSRLRK